MNLIRAEVEKVLRCCDGVHHSKLLLTKQMEHPCSYSGLPSAKLTDVSSVEWEHDHCSKKQARAAGLAMMKRIRHFDSFSSLPDNDSHQVVELSWKDLDIGGFLGSGGFSSVFLVSFRPEQMDPHQEIFSGPDISASSQRTSLHGFFALKFLDKKVWDRGTGDLSLVAADLASEAKMVSRLNHENIIQLHGMAGGCPSTSFSDKRGSSSFWTS